MKLRHDQAILVLTLALTLLGLGMVFSASHELARTRYDDAFFFLRRQLIRAVIGVILLLVASNIDYRVWRRWARLGLLLAVVGLTVVFAFNAVRGARGWVRIMGATLQPVEFARLALVAFLASEIARRGDTMRSFRAGFAPLAVAVGAVLALVLKQPDFGSAMALSLVAFTLFYVGGARWRHLLGSGAVLLGGAILLALGRPHVRTRILGYLQPGAHAASDAYQSLQSVLSIGSGGIFGRGLGTWLRFLRLCSGSAYRFHLRRDGEELGFVGCAVVLVLFLLLVGRAVRVARGLEDPFGRLLAVGIGMSLFWYAALNLLVATRLFPVTGLPLPLVSYGGSSLVSQLFALGVLRNLARAAEPPPKRAGRWPIADPAVLEPAL